MENTEEGCSSNCLHALIPTEVKESLLRDLGHSWVRSKPELLDQVLGKVGNNCRSWSLMMEEVVWDRIQT